MAHFILLLKSAGGLWAETQECFRIATCNFKMIFLQCRNIIKVYQLETFTYWRAKLAVFDGHSFVYVCESISIGKNKQVLMKIIQKVKTCQENYDGTRKEDVELIWAVKKRIIIFERERRLLLAIYVATETDHCSPSTEWLVTAWQYLWVSPVHVLHVVNVSQIILEGKIWYIFSAIRSSVRFWGFQNRSAIGG